MIRLIHKQEGDNFLVIIKDAKEAAQNTRNAKFLWFQLFIDVLIRMQHRARDRDDLIEYCRNSDSLNQNDLNIVENFEDAYTAERAIWWYSLQSCFYKLINKALRNQDFDALYVFRCFITDVAKQLQERYQSFMRTNTTRSPLTLYRGQVISIVELEGLKDSINGYVSMNSFLSASYKKSVALRFAREPDITDNTRRILFKIEIKPNCRTKPFSDIADVSIFEEEEEVLIMVGALFLIKEVIQDEQNHMWVARVTLADEDDFALQDLFKRMKQDIGDETNGSTLAKLLLRMDENEQAKKCYQRLIREHQLTQAEYYIGMGCALTRCGDEHNTKYLKDSLEIFQRLGLNNHPSLGETYSHLGEAYRKRRDYDQSEKYLEKARRIQEDGLRSDPLALASTYNRLGKTYTLKQNYEEAETCFIRALSIREEKLPCHHPQLAGVYGNLGWLCEYRENYEQALIYYQKSLDIARVTLPPDHRLVRGARENIHKLKSQLK